MTFADQPTKQCWKCKVERPIEQFHRNKTKSSGRASECTHCVKAYNKAHVRERFHYYQGQRRDKRISNISWYLFLECRTRAKRKGIVFDLLPEDIVVPERCPVFGFLMAPKALTDRNRDYSPSVDRMDCRLGYVRGNIQVISYLANRMKSNATPDQLAAFSHWILETQHDAARGVDTRKSPPADKNHRADQAPYGSCAWQTGNDKDASNGCADPVEEVAARSNCH